LYVNGKSTLQIHLKTVAREYEAKRAPFRGKWESTSKKRQFAWHPRRPEGIVSNAVYKPVYNTGHLPPASVIADSVASQMLALGCVRDDRAPPTAELSALNPAS
jgi:hypothetical protein